MRDEESRDICLFESVVRRRRWSVAGRRSSRCSHSSERGVEEGRGRVSVDGRFRPWNPDMRTLIVSMAIFSPVEGEDAKIEDPSGVAMTRTNDMAL